MNVLRYSAEWHSSIPVNSILRNDELSPTARLLWSILQSYASPDSPRPYPGHLKLMKHLWLKRTMLHVYQKELIDHGFLKIQKQRRARAGRWASNVYILQLPAPCSVDRTRTVFATPNTDGVRYNGHRPTEHEVQPVQKKNTQQNITTTSGSASPTPPSGNGVLKNGDLPAEASKFAKAWQYSFQQFFETTYRLTPSDKLSLQNYFTDNEGAQADVLLLLSFQAWLDYVNAAPNPHSGFDPWFYRRKSRSIAWVLNHSSNMEDEMRKSKSSSMHMDPAKVVEIIKGGRAEYLESEAE